MSLKVSGVVLSLESETFVYKSKKTGNQESMTKATLILQGSYGVLVGQVFNPKADLSLYKVGSKVVDLEIRKYENDGGIQKCDFRL
jgi:hypothetical protein